MNTPAYRLTEHFALKEYVGTNRVAFREKNRLLTPEQVYKLWQLALLQEVVRGVLKHPILNHSGYRCPELNAAVGSTDRSQHMLCEAVDFSRAGFNNTEETILRDFHLIADAARRGQLKFGQLIVEQDRRFTADGEKTSVWLHLSLGAPWRPIERCGQLLQMKDGVYTSLGTV